MHILKYTEWEQGGYWYCNDVSDIAGPGFHWSAAMRLLNLTPLAFVEMLATQFKPDRIKYDPEHNVLVYCWKSQQAMRKYKNWLNAEARKRNFLV